MIDLDQSRFKSRLALDRALARTLDKIKDTFDLVVEEKEQPVYCIMEPETVIISISQLSQDMTRKKVRVYQIYTGTI